LSISHYESSRPTIKACPVSASIVMVKLSGTPSLSWSVESVKVNYKSLGHNIFGNKGW